MGRFARWFAKSKEAVTSEEVLSRLREVEYAAKLRYLEQPQSEVDKSKGEAAAAIIASLDKVPVAVIQIGSLLLIKTTENEVASVFVRTLTRQELMLIESKPELLEQPSKLLNLLASVAGGDIGKTKDLEAAIEVRSIKESV
jgi:hypothetical protein